MIIELKQTIYWLTKLPEISFGQIEVAAIKFDCNWK